MTNIHGKQTNYVHILLHMLYTKRWRSLLLRTISSNLWYKRHLSGQWNCWSLRCRRCSNYIMSIIMSMSRHQGHVLQRHDAVAILSANGSTAFYESCVSIDQTSCQSVMSQRCNPEGWDEWSYTHTGKLRYHMAIHVPIDNRMPLINFTPFHRGHGADFGAIVIMSRHRRMICPGRSKRITMMS